MCQNLNKKRKAVVKKREVVAGTESAANVDRKNKSVIDRKKKQRLVEQHLTVRKTTKMLKTKTKRKQNATKTRKQ